MRGTKTQKSCELFRIEFGRLLGDGPRINEFNSYGQLVGFIPLPRHEQNSWLPQ